MTPSPRTATCHCGAVELSVILSEGLTSARRCNCSYCARRGTIAVTALAKDVQVVKGADRLRLYQFGTKTAKHYFCSICGIHTHHQRRSNPLECGINAACLTGVDVSSWPDVPWTDGQNHSCDR